MADATQAPAVRRFGAFEVNLQSGELRKNGMRLRLSGQPFQILAVLLERPGEVVTREELHSKLWPTDTFVDFDHGLNNAVARIREVLDDSSETPRYLETIPRRGYRFIAPLLDVRPAAATPSAAEPREASQRGPDVGGVATVEITPSRTRRAMAAVALCLITAALVFILRGRVFRTNQAAQIHSIAVIPLANLSGDPAQEYFADGMTDELITALAKNRSLRVVSRTSAMQYKGVQRPVREIARELGVDGILEGSISRSSTRVHMTVQLIYAPSDSHVWAESYDRDLNQAYSLPEELSQTVAKEVKVATSPAPAPRYISPEAHDAYLRGRFFWFAWDFPQATTNFEQAIQLQPDYAVAWSWLSATYQLEAIDGSRPASEVGAPAESAARKALELDDSLPDAHWSMCGWYHFFAWDLSRADAECRRAIELSPSSGEPHYMRHWVLMAMERQDEAAQEEKRDVELDPFARAWSLGNFYLMERQFESAISELEVQSRFRPDDSGVHENLATAYWLKGRYKESEQESEKLLQLEGRSDSVIALRKAWQRGGETAVGQWGAEDIKAQARKRYVSPYALASAVSYTRDKEETVKYLNEAFGQHDANLINIQNDPLFDFIHSDPRYQALVRKIGLQLAP